MILRHAGGLVGDELRLRIGQSSGRVRQSLPGRCDLGGVFGRARRPKSDLRLHKRLAGIFHRCLFGCGRRQPQRNSSGDEGILRGDKNIERRQHIIQRNCNLRQIPRGARHPQSPLGIAERATRSLNSKPLRSEPVLHKPNVAAQLLSGRFERRHICRQRGRKRSVDAPNVKYTIALLAERSTNR